MSQYHPQVFDAVDEKTAREIILTPTDGASPEERWATETPYLGERIAELLDLTEADTVIDFGCGIGRVAKELIARTGCSVVGVDISAPMREMAVKYVASERFSVVSPEEFDAKVAGGWRGDAAYICWVLQHCIDPAAEVRRIVGALHPASDVVVVNLSHMQSIPIDSGWSLQPIDMRAMLRETMTEITAEPLPDTATTPDVVAVSFLGMYLTRQPVQQAAAAPAQGGLLTRLRRLFS